MTFNVVNLYTNIPHTFKLETLDYRLENHSEILHARFNKEFVLECAKFILQNNNMKFNNEFYNQIKGTSMGTIFAPTYATLSMRFFEIKLYSVCTLKYGVLLTEYIKENWNHFLDECYTVLRSSQISPEELLFTLNSINPSIQFTMEYSKDQRTLLFWRYLFVVGRELSWERWESSELGRWVGKWVERGGKVGKMGE